jgi:HAD superfamily hydrolase (TIGR01509 family)
MIKYILWDNDGVLVDTEKYYFRAIREVMLSRGVAITEDQFRENLLVRSKGLWHLLEEKGFSKDEVNTLKEERDRIYLKYLETGDIAFNGAEETLKKLYGRYNMAIVTSSKRNHFEAIHTRTGFLKYFEFALTNEDYEKAKPDPVPYLAALRKMNASAEEAVVIEDSLRGLTSAIGAGLRCIVIPTELTSAQDFSGAALVLDSIKMLADSIEKM